MTEYTVHVPVPDAAIGAVLMYQLIDSPDVTMAVMRSGGGTWISFGVVATEDDDEGITMAVSALRYAISRKTDLPLPEGYDSLEAFERSPFIITHGRTVIYSEGIVV